MGEQVVSYISEIRHVCLFLGKIVFPLCIKWASRAFLTTSRLLRMSWSGIRMTWLIECPAWLKCKETGVGSLSCWWFRMDRRCSPNRSFSWRLVFLGWLGWQEDLRRYWCLSVGFACRSLWIWLLLRCTCTWNWIFMGKLDVGVNRI